jgi:hypothetical protein
MSNTNNYCFIETEGFEIDALGTYCGMTLTSMTEGTQPKKLQIPFQPIIPQPRPVAEVRTHIVYICSFYLPMQSVVLYMTPEICLPSLHR